jgi:electron transfer flavoprotein alpha subunit
MTRPLLRGKLSEILRFVPKVPGVVSLTPGSFSLPRPSSARSDIPIDYEPFRSPIPKFDPLNAELLHRSVQSPESLELEDAQVVVAGGKGMGSAQNFLLLQELAALLGGAVGASRIAVDLGWAGKERLVGQTGRKIAPELYIACGISGAPQHRAGLRDPRYLLAINTDSNAPIFRNATWAVVGDAVRILREWIPLLKGDPS